MKDVLRKSEHQARVESFMQQAGQPVRSAPEIPSELERIRIVKLIFEDAKETAIALGISVTAEGQKHSVPVTDCHLTFKADQEPNLVEAADGFADLHVVVTSGQIACGIADEALQEMIDASNLAKFESPTCMVCNQKMKQLASGEWECRHENWGVSDAWKYLPLTNPKEAGPYRRSDGKWIKPPYWQKPDIAGLLAEQTKQTKQTKQAEGNEADRAGMEWGIRQGIKDWVKIQAQGSVKGNYVTEYDETGDPGSQKIMIEIPHPSQLEKVFGGLVENSKQILYEECCELLKRHIFSTP